VGYVSLRFDAILRLAGSDRALTRSDVGLLPARTTSHRAPTTRLYHGIVAAIIVACAPVLLAQFSPQTSSSRNILEGHWQSCLDMGTGRYGERVYDHMVNGVAQFEVHLGPRREFAIYKGVQDEHRDHASPDNLLKPYRVAMDGTRAGHRWSIPSLNLVFTVTLGGGSRTDCENWFILLEPLDKTS
jgi:hypothetical protein